MSKTGFVRLRWLVYAVIAGALLTLLSCSEDKPNEPDEPEQYVELSDTTEALADTTLALLTSVEDSVLAFSRSNPQLDSASEGDIIICGISDKTPYGFLGRVTRVSAGHDSLIVTRATLEEAIENCRIEFSRELSLSDVDSTTSLKRVRMQKATDAYEFGLALDNVVLYDADGSENTTKDQVVANGAVYFNLGFDGHLEIKWFKLKYFLFKINAEENAQLDIEARVNIVDIHKAKTLVTYYFAPFAIGPVVFTPKMDVRVGIDGEVSVSATAVVTQTNTLEAGIIYEHSDWGTIKDFSTSFDYDMPAVASEAAIKGWAGPQLSLLIYGVVGPYAEADAYLRLQADLLPPLAWQLYGGLEARVGAEVDVLGYTMVDYHATPIQYEKELANGTASENPIHFTDPNLEAVIREKINKPSGDIYPSEVAGIHSLDAGGRQIISLDGIESLVNLTWLELHGNQISNLAPLSSLTSLTDLDLAGNQITDLAPLSGLTSLTHLRLAGNQISNLTPLSGLTSLTVLFLYNNQISDLAPLSGLTSLWWLRLSNNQISDLAPLSSLASLNELGLGYNHISDLAPLSGLTSLTKLSLAGNQISDLAPLSGLTSLNELGLGYNQISDLAPLSGLTSLTKLDLGNNQISDLSPLSGLTSLYVLYLYSNQISDLAPLSGLTSLTNLRLDHNQISGLVPLSDLTSLTELGLRYNQISDLAPLSGLTSLTWLDLHNNQISDLYPLVENEGLGAGDVVCVKDNPLSGTSISVYIPALEARGVHVGY